MIKVSPCKCQKVHLINPTPLEIDKATDFTTRDARVLTQTFGNYVIVNNVVGTWDFQGLREVALHDAAATAIASKTLQYDSKEMQ